jgi:hypothetical protein
MTEGGNFLLTGRVAFFFYKARRYEQENSFTGHYPGNSGYAANGD